MSQKLKRGGASARKTALAAGKARKLRAARSRTGSAMDSVMALIPFSEAQLTRVFLAVILGGAVALAWLVASLAGVPAMARAQVASVAAQAGFEVRKVEVRGVRHLNELKVYEQVLGERNRAMPQVDLGALRAGLMQLSWVADARVSRQLPDTLVVDIVERRPHAVLRLSDEGSPDRYVLIDDAGHRLEPVPAARIHGRLVLSGDGAEDQVQALTSLLSAAPALRPQVAQAAWVGQRRWNLTFRTGQVLALPEGEQASAGALVGFARLDGTNRLIGGKAAAFDMRAGDRIYIRVPGRSDVTPKPAGTAQVASAGAKPAPKTEDQ